MSPSRQKGSPRRSPHVVGSSFAHRPADCGGRSSPGPAGLAAAAEARPRSRPASRWVYVGTYTGKDSKGIYRCEFDSATGKLSEPVLVAETDNPTFLAIHPSGQFLYAVGEIDDFGGKKAGAVNAYALDPKTGDLKLLNQQSSGGSGPCYVSLDKATASTSSSPTTAAAASPCCRSRRTAASARRPPSCSTRAAASIRTARKGRTPTRSTSTRPASTPSPADLGLDKLLVYKFDAAKGTLTPNDPPAMDTAPGAGPRHFAFHPDGKHAYACGEMDSTVMAMDYDADKGVLTKIQTLSTLPAPDEGQLDRRGAWCIRRASSSTSPTAATTASPSSPSMRRRGKLTAVGDAGQGLQGAAQLQHRSRPASG